MAGKVLRIDMRTMRLSGAFRAYKTERFIKETAHLRDADAFLAKLAESIGEDKSLTACHTLTTADGKHAFTFLFGKDAPAADGAGEKDILFFAYTSADEVVKRGDGSLSVLLAEPNFSVTAEPAHCALPPADFKKLYRLSNADHVNFPLLNKMQRRLVETEDRHVLAQGVAGSGKTNICIDKIVYAACRGYQGRVLYTTYSRGLAVDTKQKVARFKENLQNFVRAYAENKVVFLDNQHKKAIENRLGIYFSVDDDDRILEKIERVISFLDEKVDYYLIEDFYARYGDANKTAADERTFVKSFVGNLKNHQLAGKLEKIKHLSYEVIYKEIYGVIFGSCEPENPQATLSLSAYLEKRGESFSRAACEIIYALSREYAAFLAKGNWTDNNFMSRALLEKKEEIPYYSLAILDEVQDLTEVNLCFLHAVSRKLFCVGDALQMINPSYFSFSYLKRLLFDKEAASVAELTHNYRNSKRIAEIVETLSHMNVRQFGTHRFVIKGESVDGGSPTSTVYVKGESFIPLLANERFNNYTVIVSGVREKERLRAVLKKQEILTVSEVKGLERDTVVLYNILTANRDKWAALERADVNRKSADENSVYRYYFNLFYVGLSRAKQHLYVSEEKEIPAFRGFFNAAFETLAVDDALARLVDTSDKAELEQEELLERVAEFIKNGQYDNARFAAEKVPNEEERHAALCRVEVNETLVRYGKYREAGIRFWEYGLPREAKEQFSLSGDTALVNLVDACAARDSGGLDIGILSFLPEVQENETARNLILEVMQKDVAALKRQQTELAKRLQESKEKKRHG